MNRFYFWANTLIGNGLGKSWICLLNQQKRKLRPAQSKQTLRATCSKGKLGFPFIALMRGNSFTLAFFCFTLNLFSNLFPITIKTSNHYQSMIRYYWSDKILSVNAELKIDLLYLLWNTFSQKFFQKYKYVI